MQNNMPIMKMWSKNKADVEFKYGGRSFFQTGSSGSSRGLSYPDDIWFADRLWDISIHG